MMISKNIKTLKRKKEMRSNTPGIQKMPGVFRCVILERLGTVPFPLSYRKAVPRRKKIMQFVDFV